MKFDMLELVKKIQSNNVSLRQHWAVRRRDKKEWALLIRNQMRLRKIKKARAKKYTLMIISYRKRLLDKDNLYGGSCKQLIDACVEEGLIFDDNPDFVDLKVEQYKSKKDHTMVIRKGIDKKK